jgi:hypothetical protein
LTGLDKSVLQIKTKNVSCHTADSKPVKQEVNSTVIVPPLVFPSECHGSAIKQSVVMLNVMAPQNFIKAGHHSFIKIK